MQDRPYTRADQIAAMKARDDSRSAHMDSLTPQPRLETGRCWADRAGSDELCTLRQLARQWTAYVEFGRGELLRRPTSVILGDGGIWGRFHLPATSCVRSARLLSFRGVAGLPEDVSCSKCGREVDEFTAIVEKWGYWSDGCGELLSCCPECARREFAPDARASGPSPRARHRAASSSDSLIFTQPRSSGGCATIRAA